MQRDVLLLTEMIDAAEQAYELVRGTAGLRTVLGSVTDTA
jgi:hypothetical protein